MSTYATDTFSGDGATVEFTLTFPYISRDHVNVYRIENSDLSETTLTVIETGVPNGDEYIWESDKKIKVGTAPTVDQTLRIQRDTPEDDQIVQWSDGSYMTAEDLNDSDQQWLYNIQELEDKFSLLEATAIKYLGAVDLTVDTAPANPEGGDFYINTGNGTVIAGWTGIEGDMVTGSEQVIYNSQLAQWQIFETPTSQQGVLLVSGQSPIDVNNADPQRPVVTFDSTGAGVLGVTSTSPVTVDNTDPQNPVIGLPDATTSDSGALSAADKTKLDGIAPGATVGIPEAPNDGQQYARKSEAWEAVDAVTQLVAGTNVTLSPADGKGVVTVNSTGGGGGGIPEAPIDGQQYARQNAAWSVVTGGNNNVTYNGASAWGNVAADGTLNNGLNIASVTRSATGTYDVVFTTPMPDANYSVVATTLSTSGRASWFNASANGFTILTVDRDGPLTNYAFSFAVHSQNALPPAGTTGTDAWLTCSGSGVLGSSFNIASVVKAISPNGQYQVTFTNPMPTADYSVQVSHTSGYGYINVFNKTTAGFQVQCRNNAGVETDIAFQAAVNATNANLPYTFTKEQIEAAINNTGAYAWGSVDGSNGALKAGNNCTTSKTGSGTYSVVFNTPLPDANYSVVAESGYSNSIITTCTISGKTANGFSVFTNDKNDASTSSDFDFTVTAAKGQPLSLGGGADAWASVASNGQLIQGHNIASVTRTGVGSYDVVFTTPMPTANYSVQSTLADLNTVSTTKIGNRTVDGFTVNTGYQPGSGTTWTPFDHNFSIAVFATDGNAGGFWGRSNDGVLTPANSTDDVQIASLNGGQLAGFRNVLINGTVSINQRGLTYAGVAVGEYWADRWKKTAGGMTQIIEEGNYKPNTEYTLSGTNVTTQQITSPASGNWTIPDVPATATMIQLEEGPLATPFELRPIGTELALAQRYYQLTIADQTGYNGEGGNVNYYIQVDYKVNMRAQPTALFTSTSATNTNSTFVDNVNGMACLKGCRVAATGTYTSYGRLTLDAEL